MIVHVKVVLKAWVYVSVPGCLCRYACMYVCRYVCLSACLSVCMYVCTHVCMYILMHACLVGQFPVICLRMCWNGLKLSMYACVHV